MKKAFKKISFGRETAVQLCSSFLAILVAFIVGGFFIAAAGANPFKAYGVMFTGAFGSLYAWSETLLRATPLMLAGVGLAVSFRCSLTSIGSEGQIVIGAIAATAVGLQLTNVPGFIAIIICLATGFVAGALYGGIAGALKAKFGISEIICTIMLNYIATSYLGMLLDNGLRDPASSNPQSPGLAESIWLPKLLDGTRLHIGILFAIVCVILYYVYMFKTPQGFRMRMVGKNSKTAQYAGVNVAGSIVTAMLISGGMSGLAGATEILGIHHRLYNDFAAGVGFDAMAVALLGRLSPAGVCVASIFFAALQVGSSTMQRTMQVPTVIVSVIQGLLILLIYTDKLYAGYITGLFNKLFPGKKEKEEAAE